MWVGGRFHGGGGTDTRWIRNLEVSPSNVVSTEDAASVVILDGAAERLDAGPADPGRLADIDAADETTYDIEHGTPVSAGHPTVVLAWTDSPDATR
jgi:hypothetical protein